MNKRLAEKNSAWFDIVLNVQINGNLSTSGNAQTGGNHTVTGTLKAGGINMNTHTHRGDSGGSTGAPR